MPTWGRVPGLQRQLQHQCPGAPCFQLPWSVAVVHGLQDDSPPPPAGEEGEKGEGREVPFLGMHSGITPQTLLAMAWSRGQTSPPRVDPGSLVSPWVAGSSVIYTLVQPAVSALPVLHRSVSALTVYFSSWKAWHRSILALVSGLGCAFVGVIVRLMALLPGEARAGLCLFLPTPVAQSLAESELSTSCRVNGHPQLGDFLPRGAQASAPRCVCPSTRLRQGD